MRAITLAWQASAPWIRFTAIMLMIIIPWSIFIALTNSPPSAPVAAPHEVEAARLNHAAANSAIDLCDAEALRSATNRSSIKFLGLPEGQRARQDGAERWIVKTRFSARNGFGAESILLARCVVSADGKQLVEMTAQDSR